MGKKKLINSQISGLVAAMGHGQSIVVVDSGYPVPADAKLIDLAVRPGLPTLIDVLDTILDEYVVSEYLLAAEARENNPRVVAFLKERLPDAKHSERPHLEFREVIRWDRRGDRSKAYIRTGDVSASGSVMLVAGWPWEEHADDDCHPVEPEINVA